MEIARREFLNLGVRLFTLGGSLFLAKKFGLSGCKHPARRGVDKTSELDTKFEKIITDASGKISSVEVVTNYSSGQTFRVLLFLKERKMFMRGYSKEGDLTGSWSLGSATGKPKDIILYREHLADTIAKLKFSKAPAKQIAILEKELARTPAPR